MRVCYVTMAFPTATETFACDEVLCLEEMGVDVSIHALRPAFAYARALAVERGVDHVPVTHGSPGNNLRGLAYGLLRPMLLWQLMGYIFRSNGWRWKSLLLSLIWVPRVMDVFRRIAHERPDVVHLYWGHFPALVGFLVQQRLPETIVTMSLRAYDLDIQFPCTVGVARAADAVRTIAATNVPKIKRLGVERDRVLLCYSGIDLNKVTTAQRVKHRILVAGRLIAEKRVQDVLNVFARVYRDWPDATLHVLGTGPEHSRLVTRARELGIAASVRFRGHVAHERVFAELAEAEVFLFLSQFSGERLPNAIKEAMASGCVCVVTPTPGIDELVVDGVNGFVVAPGDLDAAHAHVHRAFANPDLLQRLATEARETVATRFDHTACTAQLLDRWRTILASKRPTAAVA